MSIFRLGNFAMVCSLFFAPMAQSQSTGVLDLDVAAEMVTSLRRQIVDDPEMFSSLLSRRIHPQYLQELDIDELLTSLMWHSQPAMGCSSQGAVAGFYSPLYNIWLAVVLDAGGQAIDARLGTGFPAGPGRSGWWPAFVKDVGNIPDAIKLTTAAQVMAFDAAFGPESCPDFGEAEILSDNMAMAQYDALLMDYGELDEEMKSSLVADLQRETGAELPDWRAEVRLQGTGEDWLCLFSSFAHPGSLLLARWVPRNDGKIEYAGHSLIDFIAAEGVH